MAIARDNATTGSNTGSQSGLTFAHSVSGSDRYLTVVVAWRNTIVGTISSVSYNGVALGFIAGQSRGGSRVEIWGLVAPDTGSNNVVITHSASFDNGCTALAISHTGVDQASPTGTASTATGATGNASVNVASATGELVIDGCIPPSSGITATVGAGQTQEANQQAGNGNAKLLSSTEPGAATVTMSWSFSASPGWAIAAFPIKPSTGSATSSERQATARGVMRGVLRAAR